MASCLLCQPPEDMPDDAMIDHARVIHPASGIGSWPDDVEHWPDGRRVVEEPTLDPADFTGEEAGSS